jgi:hypothetical protein
VARIDAIEQSCVQLPEDHGIIFPGGYYLQSGDYKVFDGEDTSDLQFERAIRSPNGEDVLYVFHHAEEGSYLLFPYNLIRKEVQNPIHCHGWTLFDDGTMVVFRSVSPEPTRVHPMQIWATPFTSDEYAAQEPTVDSFLGKVGNAELVRGISDTLSVVRLISEQTPSRRIYEGLVGTTTRVQDAYYWLDNAAVGDLLATLKGVRENAELIIDEFEKVVALRSQATRAIEEAEEAKRVLERDLRPENWRTVEPFMKALTALRTQRGHLITLKEMRYVDRSRLDELEGEMVEHFDRVSREAVEFLLRDEALDPITGKLDELLAKIEALVKTSELPPLAEELEATSDGLNVLTEIMGTLEVDDPTKRTAVLEGISEVFGHLNRVRATLSSKKNELLEAEGKAEFAAQFRLFSQSVSNALALCDTPEACDEQLSRLMLQLEELEGRFSEFDVFLAELTEKRDEVYEAFDSKRQTLVDARQRRAKNLWNAAERILQSIQRRSRTFESADQLNAYFASDSMVMKLRQLSEQLLELGDSVKSDEIEAKLKAARQDAMRGLRDRLDLFEDGADVVKLGKHRFNVNTRALELTLVPGDEGMFLHLTGTDFHELVDDEAFMATRPFWQQQLVSESEDVYRGEYLAACMLADAEEGRKGLTLELLQERAREESGLLATVRGYSNDLYDEGYERGLHDADTAAILAGLIELRATAGLLRFAPDPRAWGCLFWANLRDEASRERWRRRGHSLGRLRAAIGSTPAGAVLAKELSQAIGAYLEEERLCCSEGSLALARAYLVEELAADQPRFVTSQEAQALVEAFRAQLTTLGQRSAFEDDQHALEGRVVERLGLARAWLGAFLATLNEDERLRRQPVLLEAAVLLVTEGALERDVSAARLAKDVTGLLGQHKQIDGRTLHASRSAS